MSVLAGFWLWKTGLHALVLTIEGCLFLVGPVKI
jgi:hypothetical protein